MYYTQEEALAMVAVLEANPDARIDIIEAIPEQPRGMVIRELLSRVDELRTIANRLLMGETS